MIDKIRFMLFKLTHKVYAVRYRTYGKTLKSEYVAIWRWSVLNYDEIIPHLAKVLKIKPSAIRIVEITRTILK